MMEKAYRSSVEIRPTCFLYIIVSDLDLYGFLGDKQRLVGIAITRRCVPLTQGILYKIGPGRYVFASGPTIARLFSKSNLRKIFRNILTASCRLFLPTDKIHHRAFALRWFFMPIFFIDIWVNNCRGLRSGRQPSS